MYNYWWREICVGSIQQKSENEMTEVYYLCKVCWLFNKSIYWQRKHKSTQHKPLTTGAPCSLAQRISAIFFFFLNLIAMAIVLIVILSCMWLNNLLKKGMIRCLVCEFSSLKSMGEDLQAKRLPHPFKKVFITCSMHPQHYARAVL